ncbi:MAG TPA: heme-binding domain-containing protein [Phycisphaerales bacterium]|nr:heme-binding domain-containing protein [Phycisphaerales bacterium]HRQ75639.1 heme-binding domain-containing protein [Phycisphaerales bacterium]
MLKKLIIRVLLVAAVLFIAIQFVPVDRSNPPVTGTVDAPVPVMHVLRTSCFDCHSNETHWPWYSYVAPVSWLVARDVREGREELNFSHWDRYDPQKRAKIAEESYEEVAEGKMPMWIYTAIHRDARVTDEELALLREWAQSMEGAH